MAEAVWSVAGDWRGSVEDWGKPFALLGFGGDWVGFVNWGGLTAGKTGGGTGFVR